MLASHVPKLIREKWIWGDRLQSLPRVYTHKSLRHCQILLLRNSANNFCVGPLEWADLGQAWLGLCIKFQIRLGGRGSWLQFGLWSALCARPWVQVTEQQLPRRSSPCGDSRDAKGLAKTCCGPETQAWHTASPAHIPLADTGEINVAVHSQGAVKYPVAFVGGTAQLHGRRHIFRRGEKTGTCNSVLPHHHKKPRVWPRLFSSFSKCPWVKFIGIFIAFADFLLS